ncbi:MAG: molybdenum cofactor cytidylyltransferase [Chloroflexi bacterium]|nr:molybdenum cofactor cytidylyltransferase [Chloroflexota bacterium]
MISAVILAAGESKRMGEPKLLLPLGGKTILEQTVDNFLDSNVDEVIVVVGYRADQMIELLRSRPIKPVLNPDYRQGMSTSIAAGLRLVGKSSQAIMIALADQPFIGSKTINHLIETFVTNEKGIAIPTYQGKRGHPVTFADRYRVELLGLRGDSGGRGIIERHPDDVLEIPVTCEGVCIDIDAAEDYRRRVDLRTGSD